MKKLATVSGERTTTHIFLEALHRETEIPTLTTPVQVMLHHLHLRFPQTQASPQKQTHSGFSRTPVAFTSFHLFCSPWSHTHFLSPWSLAALRPVFPRITLITPSPRITRNAACASQRLVANDRISVQSKSSASPRSEAARWQRVASTGWQRVRRVYGSFLFFLPPFLCMDRAKKKDELGLVWGDDFILETLKPNQKPSEIHGC